MNALDCLAETLKAYPLLGALCLVTLLVLAVRVRHVSLPGFRAQFGKGPLPLDAASLDLDPRPLPKR